MHHKPVIEFNTQGEPRVRTAAPKARRRAGLREMLDDIRDRATLKREIANYKAGKLDTVSMDQVFASKRR